MTISFDVARSAPRAADAVGVAVPSDGPVPRSLGHSRAALAALGFEGRLGQTLVLAGPSGVTHVAVGVGERESVSDATLRTAAAALARAIPKLEHVATALADVDGVDARAAGQAVAEGLVLAAHRYVEHKTDKTAPALERVTLVASAAAARGVEAGAARGRVIAEAVNFGRDLANTPPAHLNARDLADIARDVGAAAGLQVEVFDEHAIAEMKLGGLMNVNKGSVEPPRVVKLTYTPRGASRGTVALVGKGVMYDSGGISLKPSDGMHVLMKMDMSGAAAVLAAMTTLKAVRPRVKVIGYLMCTDNMPSGSAMKLGDVITIRNGKTVEIHNTDAEGRLVLADGLALAVEDGADAIVDIATLTGACMNALGVKIAGVMGNDDAWVEQVREAATRADERVWPLPLPADYRRLLDSEVADMKNVGGPYGGALTAGLFLKEFVGEVPWVHLDIAGPMRSENDDGWLSKGATAFGVRTFVELLDGYEAA
jgi:leucyl aminopeptidase